jgi:hypothetical protein
MSWRGIVRFSLDEDDGSKFRNSVKPLLDDAGFTNPTTGVWEVKKANQAAVAFALAKLLTALADPHAYTPSANSVTALDHIWIYIDRD